ncbi:MAG: uroporphyrinogen decarboxylase [Proteobacteria bacterium]|nr:uroporphyrinogen decarboxylase [Pseudomonadota bacterium]
MNKLLNTLLKKEKNSTPPIWVMRQAGRYLPEYREIRVNVKNFLELCYTPKLASEVTLQPIRRFGFDAAIIFSDILVIPDALGVKVEFVKNEGPKLQKISSAADLKNLKTSNIKSHLNPVFEALDLTKSKLNKETALIGFSGAPWTLACYMIEGAGSKNFESVRIAAVRDEEFFSQLIEILTQSVIEYLSLQIKAGADIVKIFDSWAGVLPPDQLRKWVIQPTKKIISELKKLHPQTPIIAFPRGIGMNYLEFARNVDCEGLAIDQTVEKKWAKENLGKNSNKILQGNLDNILLAFGSKKEIEKEVLEILETSKDQPFIFNLGHGILPQTPIENVELLLNLVRKN